MNRRAVLAAAAGALLSQIDGGTPVPVIRAAHGKRKLPTPTGSGPPAGWWGADLEAVPLGTAQYVSGSPNATSAALDDQWTWFGQPGQESDYGLPDVVSASAAGLPGPPGGDKVVKLRHPITNPAVMRKCYKFFFDYNWPQGTEAEPDNWAAPSPADVSARYIAHLYIPLSTWSQQYNSWANVMQFKERVITTGGDYQDPSWWVEIRPGGGGTSGYRANMRCAGFVNTSATIDMTPYFDKWVKWEYRLTQGVKVEWYLDGVLKDTGFEADRHVGRRNTGTSYNGETITTCREWIFGAGNYNSNQAQSGPSGTDFDYNWADTTVYLDWAWIEPL